MKTICQTLSDFPTLRSMKRVFLIATLLFCLLPSQGSAAVAADDVYISIFNMIMAGDNLKEKGQGRAALEKYLEAERDLKKLKSAYPSWNSKIVSFRLKYLADKIGPLKVQYPGTTIPDKKGAAGGGAKGKAAKGPAGVNSAMRDINSKLIDTSQENARLRDQLREALAARPAEADPAAYAKAQEQIRTLQQGKDVSSITLQQQKAELDKLREDYNELQQRMTVLASRSKEQQLREENSMLKQQVAQLQQLNSALPNIDELKRRVSLLETDLNTAEAARQTMAVQNQQLQKQLASGEGARLAAENAALKEQVSRLNQLAGQVGNVEAMNQRLAQTESELKAQKVLVAELTQQNKSFETQIREGDLPRLRSENQALKSEVAKLNQIAAKVPEVEQLRSELASAKAKVQAEQAMRQNLLKDKQKLEALLTDPNLQIGSGPSEEFKALEKEKKALESQLKKLAAEQKKTSEQSADTGRKAAEQAARLKQLERERLELRKALEKALQDAESAKRASAKAKPAESPEVKKKLQVAEAKIRALEARAEPYTAEELALMRVSAAQPAKAVAAPAPQQPKREFPANAGQIALQAQRAYNSQRYAEAESKFKDVLELEKDNVFTLANLAAAQMELNKLAEAEANLNQALQLHPNDAFSLSLKGLVKFRQNDFDSALDLLSQAAVLDPRNAQTQNYLGLALSQKGLRIAAEAAFRKAVKIAPDYTVAHYNLAVFYATADSPSPELARWHYQKALAAGHPKSPDLEKMLAGK